MWDVVGLCVMRGMWFCVIIAVIFVECGLWCRRMALWVMWLGFVCVLRMDIMECRYMCEVWGPGLRNSVLLWKQRQSLHVPLKVLNQIPLPIPQRPDLSGPCSVTSPLCLHRAHTILQWAHIQALLIVLPSSSGSFTERWSSPIALGLLWGSCLAQCASCHAPKQAHTLTTMDELEWRRNTGEVFRGRGDLPYPWVIVFDHLGWSKLKGILLWLRDSWGRYKSLRDMFGNH